MTIKPLGKKVTAEELDKVLAGIKKGSRFIGPTAGVPNGVVLHNTYHPNLSRVEGYLRSRKYTPEQLIDNWWVNYIRMKWFSGPHIFVFPVGIYIACPLDHRGTHSPTFNRDKWGIEMIGDYETEQIPFTIKDLTAQAAACFFRHLGVQPDERNLKFHREDPRTDHKCPGKNVLDKGMWINLIKEKL